MRRRTSYAVRSGTSGVRRGGSARDLSQIFFAALKLGVSHTLSSYRLAFYLSFSAAACTAASLFLVFLPDGRRVVALIRQVKRRRALQACNPPRDSLVDGAPMALAPWVTM